jgi:hypothetical protein
MPLEKALTKLGSDAIEGEKQIGVGAVAAAPRAARVRVWEIT